MTGFVLKVFILRSIFYILKIYTIITMSHETNIVELGDDIFYKGISKKYY